MVRVTVKLTALQYFTKSQLFSGFALDLCPTICILLPKNASNKILDTEDSENILNCYKSYICQYLDIGLPDHRNNTANDIPGR